MALFCADRPQLLNSRMNLRRLRVLVELSRLGTMRAVADLLQYGTSAVSQQLAALEREVGTALIEPDGRRVRLTPAGRRLAGHAEGILAAVAAAEVDLSTEAAPHGSLRVASYSAAVAAGRTPNGFFGARIMWGTMTELTDALRHAAHGSTASDVELLTEAFGSPRFVHLRRDDPVAQAVSWARAEQTQFWHPGDQVAPSGHQPHFDRDLIGGLVDTITAHEAAWQAWFTHRGLIPHEVAYEELSADPSGVTRTVLEFLGLDPSAGGTITVHDRRQADDLNADWISRFRG